MIINRENYELYAVDYMDGNLSGKEKLEMEQFLAKNPDIKAELEELGLVVLVPDERVVYQDKDLLMHSSKNYRFWWMGAFILLFFVATIAVFWYQFGSNTTAKTTAHTSEEKMLNNLPKETPVIQQKNNQTERAENQVTNGNTQNIANDVIPSDSDHNKKIMQPAGQDADKYNNTTNKVQPFENKNGTDQFPNKIKESTIENGKTKDSTKTEIQKPLLKPIPMAVLEAKPLPLEDNFDSKMEHLNNQNTAEIANSMAFEHKKATNKTRGIKTPFGKIQFSEIAEALLPESYIASK